VGHVAILPLVSEHDWTKTVSVVTAKPETGFAVSALPSTIGRFSILAKLGEGGMGIVYLARDPQLDRQLAVKLMHPRAHNQIATTRLLREAQSLARLSHSNVVHVYEIGQHADGLFIAMEYVDGVTLGQWIRAGQRPWWSNLPYLLQAGRGLQAAHDAGLVHRDFKPANVMVGTDGRVRVLDFGLARPAAESDVSNSVSNTHNSHVTATGTLVGTPAYMAPEQFTGGVGDALSDQFSFCATAFECLFGETPIIGTNLEEISTNIKRKTLRAIPRNTALPDRICAALERGLAFSPQDRWPNMAALLAELDALQLEAELSTYAERRQLIGKLDPIELAAVGGVAAPGAFRLSDTLYGVDTQLATLHAALARVRAGASATELLCIEGTAGSGKSALVRAFRRTQPEGETWMLSSKFDQRRSQLPLAGIVALIDSLVALLLRESVSTVQTCRRELLASLGAGASVLTEIAPSLIDILGPQPRAPASEPSDRLNRISLAFERFVTTLARPTRPLTLFIDDMQWADTASLSLLTAVLASPHASSLLIIIAARNDDVATRESLDRLLEVSTKSITVHRLLIEPLRQSAIEALLFDVLGNERSVRAGLAEVILAKTAGNPFFIRQFLRSLHDDHMITFDAAGQTWTWSLDAITTRAMSADVVELLLRRLSVLPPDTLRILQLAGCIGNRFALRTLATVAQLSPAQVLARVWPAFEQGLLLADESTTEAREQVELRFRHDRIQQAVSASLDEHGRALAHLQIGRLLLATPADQRSPRLFEIVDHLDMGRALIDDPAERRELGLMNFECGRKASAAAAYASAIAYLEVADTLLGDDDWFEINLERTRALYLDGRSADADVMHPILAARARTDAERLTAYEVHLEHAMLAGHYDEAIAVGGAALRIHAIALPGSDASILPLLGELGSVIQAKLHGRDFDELRHAPELSDPSALALLGLLARLGILGYMSSRPLLTAWTALEMVTRSLFWRSSIVGYSYCCHGYLLAVQGDYDGSRAFTQIGMEMVTASDDPLMLSRAAGVSMNLIGHLEHPLREAADTLRAIYPRALDCGNLTQASYFLLYIDYWRLIAGDRLSEICADVEAHLLELQRFAPMTLTLMYQPAVLFLLGSLTGRTIGGPELALDPDGFLATCGAVPIAKAWHLAAAVQVDYLAGRLLDVQEVLARVAAVEVGVPGQMLVVEARFWSALTLLALFDRLDADARVPVEQAIAAWQAQLQVLAARRPANFRHLYLLVEAERARVRADSLDDVLSLYEQTIDAAQASAAIDREALACRLFGEFWQARGSARTSAVYRQMARERYSSWGADSLVAALD
jgi:predicted ATPase/predicted Ser/Thr protein kinase